MTKQTRDVEFHGLATNLCGTDITRCIYRDTPELRPWFESWNCTNSAASGHKPMESNHRQVEVFL